MTKTMLRSTLGLLLIAIPALASAGGGTPINERQAAKRGGRVSISNISGTVTVSPWSQSEVEVTGTLGAGSERLRFDVDGDRTEIEVVLPKGRNVNVKGSDLIVRVPERSDLEIAVVSANVELTVDADVEVACVSGEVRVTGESTDVDVSVVSGEVDVRLTGKLERANIATVSGDVTLASPLAGDGRVSIESVSGDIDLGLADDLSASFDVQTFSGKLRNKLSNDRAEGGFGPGSNLTFSTGGKARIRVQTFSGDVLLDGTSHFDAR